MAELYVYVEKEKKQHVGFALEEKLPNARIDYDQSKSQIIVVLSRQNNGELLKKIIEEIKGVERVIDVTPHPTVAQ